MSFFELSDIGYQTRDMKDFPNVTFCSKELSLERATVNPFFKRMLQVPPSSKWVLRLWNPLVAFPKDI